MASFSFWIKDVKVVLTGKTNAQNSGGTPSIGTLLLADINGMLLKTSDGLQLAVKA